MCSIQFPKVAPASRPWQLWPDEEAQPAGLGGNPLDDTTEAVNASRQICSVIADNSVHATMPKRF